jgi:hypothetical protein
MGRAYRNGLGDWVKQCARCHVVKPATTEHFSKCNRLKDKWFSSCKPCVKKFAVWHTGICANDRCGKEFQYKKKGKNRTPVFCSYKCSNSSRTGRFILECVVCGNQFKSKNTLAMTCCQDCKNQRKRDVRLLHKYGLSLADYNQMLTAQAGLCGICGIKPPDKDGVLAVDHCHETGKVRGLLCRDCNAGLGLFRNNVLILQHAVRYIRKNITNPLNQLTHSTDGISGEIPEYWQHLYGTRSSNE